MVLVTGASGFVGGALIQCLVDRDQERVVATTRHFVETLPDLVRQVQVSDLSQSTDWQEALRGVDVVVHCAARVHVMNERSSDPLAEFRRINVEGTMRLAQQAAAVGVRRFIFVSSIKVNGEATVLGHPFTANDVPMPQDPYGVSKMEAEQGLRELSVQTGMEVVIIRPPLVYGPGAKANFASMVQWLKRGIPLPLGAITSNSRSLVYLGNLVDLLRVCIDHPKAANQTFLVSDAEDVSTTEMLIRAGRAMGKKVRLLPIPVLLLEMGAAIVGKKIMAQRLCGTLQVDIEKTERLLGWRPPFAFDDGLFFAVNGIQNSRNYDK